MPAEFQKAMGEYGNRIQKHFLGHFVIVRRGTIDERMKITYSSLRKLDTDNLQIKLNKCNFVQNRTRKALLQDFLTNGNLPFTMENRSKYELKIPS